MPPLINSLLFNRQKDTPCRLVNLMAVNDTNCLMMSQRLLKAVKSFLRLNNLKDT